MPAPKPKALGPFATNVSTTFTPVLCQDASQCSFQLDGAPAGSPVIAFKVQGSNDFDAVKADQLNATTTARWVDMTLPIGSVHGTAITFAGPAVSATWTGDGATTLAAMIDVTDLPCFLRLVATRSGGGSATPGLTAIVQLRGGRI